MAVRDRLCSGPDTQCFKPLWNIQEMVNEVRISKRSRDEKEKSEKVVMQMALRGRIWLTNRYSLDVIGQLRVEEPANLSWTVVTEIIPEN